MKKHVLIFIGVSLSLLLSSCSKTDEAKDVKTKQNANSEINTQEVQQKMKEIFKKKNPKNPYRMLIGPSDYKDQDYYHFVVFHGNDYASSEWIMKKDFSEARKLQKNEQIVINKKEEKNLNKEID